MDQHGRINKFAHPHLSRHCADKAPFTKLALIACVGATTAVLSIPGGAAFTALKNKEQLALGEWYRLFTGLLPYTTLAEGLFSWFLLYRFRAFERQMGSSRFSMFLLLCGAWAVGTRAATVLLLPKQLSGGLASGPYELLFALFVYYYRAIPKLHPDYFTVCGLRFSDKSLTYLLGAQLLFNGGMSSVLPSLSGLLFGALYMSDALRLQRLTWPRAFRSFCRSWVAPIVDPDPNVAAASASPSGSSPGANGDAAFGFGGGRGGGAGGDAAAVARMLRAAGTAANRRGGDAAAAAGNGAAPARTQQPEGAYEMPPPDPAAVERLINMGFERVAVERAMRRAFNNENAAVNFLLEG